MLDDFLDLDNEPEKGIMVIDFSQIALSSIMGYADPGDVLEEDLIRHIMLSCIQKHIATHKTNYPTIVLAFDNARPQYWRRQIAYYYKKSRKKDREKNQWDYETIFKHINTIKAEFQERLPYICIDIPGVEADDIIGTITYKYMEEKPIMIISSDGDFTQLHRHHNVKQWSPIQKKWVRVKYGSPQNDLEMKIIKGDKKDTVANIKSPGDHYILEGAKRAPSIYQKELDVWLGQNPVDVIPLELMDRYLENEKLIDLRLVPEDIKAEILHIFDTYKVPTRRGLYSYFVKKRLVKLMDRVSDF